MRNRWQLFTSNIIVFVSWYLLFYIVTLGGGEGVLSALGDALLALAVGLLAGVIVGAAAHAIDLHITHRGVRAGDARGGARVTLGRLPERTAVRPDAPPATVDETPPPDSAPDRASVPESVLAPTVLPVPTADAPAASPAPALPGRLAAECAAFARGHAGVRVTPDSGGGVRIGFIDRAVNPPDFSAFLALIDELSCEGADVSAVAVAQDAGGLPVSVTFPISDDEKEPQA